MTMLVAMKNKNGMVLMSDTQGTGVSNEELSNQGTRHKKIFPLRSNKPIAVMVCGNAKIMNTVLVEDIVTDYYNNSNLKFDTLDEYCKDFFEYIASDKNNIFKNFDNTYSDINEISFELDKTRESGLVHNLYEEEEEEDVRKFKDLLKEEYEDYADGMLQELESGLGRVSYGYVKLFLDSCVKNKVNKEAVDILSVFKDQMKVIPISKENLLALEMSPKICDILDNKLTDDEIKIIGEKDNIFPTVMVAGYGDKEECPIIKKFMILWRTDNKISIKEFPVEESNITLFGFTKYAQKGLELQEIKEILDSNEENASLESMSKISEWLINFTEYCLQYNNQPIIVKNPSNPVYLYK